MLESKSKRDKVNLVFWEQVQAVKGIRDERERRREALQLHVAHSAMAPGAQANPVDGEEAEELLDARAERVLRQLQDKWLTMCANKHLLIPATINSRTFAHAVLVLHFRRTCEVAAVVFATMLSRCPRHNTAATPSARTKEAFAHLPLPLATEQVHLL